MLLKFYEVLSKRPRDYQSIRQLSQLLEMYYFLGVFPRFGGIGGDWDGAGDLYSVGRGRGRGPRTEGQKGQKWGKSEYFGLGAIELLGVRVVFFFIFVRFGVMNVMV